MLVVQTPPSLHNRRHLEVQELRHLIRRRSPPERDELRIRAAAQLEVTRIHDEQSAK
jgi:hypothetical protein